MIQNINFKENEQFAFMEEIAKSGIVIYKDNIIKHLSDATHFNLFVKIVDFYTKNISLTVFEYYEFIIDILEENNTALIKAEYCIKVDENSLREYFKFIGNNFNCISEMAQNVDLCKSNYLKVSKNLINKKINKRRLF